MKSLLLSLITAAALLVAADPADARPPHWRGGYNGVRYYPSINTSPYWNGYYPGYYPGSYSGYYPNAVYPASGLSLNFGSFGLRIGNGYAAPYFGGYGSPYYGGYSGYGGWGNPYWW